MASPRARGPRAVVAPSGCDRRSAPYAAASCRAGAGSPRAPATPRAASRARAASPASRIQAVVLRALASALQSARLARIGQTHVDAATLELARNPAPARRRLDRDDVEPAVARLDPRNQRLS